MGEPQQYNRKEFLHRVGTFFLLVGVGLFVFFLLSEGAGKPVLSYFCWGTVLIVVAFIFRAQYKRTYTPSGRFSVLQKFKPKSKQEQGKK
jgi:uncharacterized membrane protein